MQRDDYELDAQRAIGDGGGVDPGAVEFEGGERGALRRSIICDFRIAEEIG